VKTGAGENLGNFHLPEGGAEGSETLYEVSDEIGELVRWFRQADERIGPLLIETPHPGSNRERSYEKDPGSLGKGPAASGSKFQNRQSLGGRIMGASVRLELLHAGILDADLFAKEMDFLLEPVAFGLPSELGVHALRSPALRQRQGGSGERNDLDYRRADTTGPA